FQAEDGIRDLTVTGVQTCALPILIREAHERPEGMDAGTLVMSGLRTESVLQSIDLVVSRSPNERPGLPPDYAEPNVSRKVVQIRSEERRVGKECAYRRIGDEYNTT